MPTEKTAGSSQTSTFDRDFISGSLTGFIVRALTQPFDVVKIRFQLQIEPIRQNNVSYYGSFAQAVSKIYKEEQWRAFWKGHVAGQLLSVVFTGVEFGTFRSLSAWSKGDDGLMSSMSNDAFFGLVAGTLAAVCAAPFEVMRTRFVAQGPEKVYSGLLSGMRELVRTEGAASLWRGVTPSVLQTAPQTSVTFTVYEALRRAYTSLSPGAPLENEEIPKYVNFCSGGLSGLVAKTVVYPMDLIKKRLEIRGFEHARRRYGQAPPVYTSSSYRLTTDRLFLPGNFLPTQFYATMACLFGVLRHEGFLGLYKGWLPATLKASLATGLTFFFFEQFSQSLSGLL